MLLSNFDCRPMRANQMNALKSFNDFVHAGGLLAIYHSM